MPDKEKPTDAGRRGGLQNPPAQTSPLFLPHLTSIFNAKRSAWRLARLSRALPKPALAPTGTIVGALGPNPSTAAAAVKRRASALLWDMLSAAGVGHATIYVLMGGA
jgi:hypothetical protein